MVSSWIFRLKKKKSLSLTLPEREGTEPCDQKAWNLELETLN